MSDRNSDNGGRALAGIYIGAHKRTTFLDHCNAHRWHRPQAGACRRRPYGGASCRNVDCSALVPSPIGDGIFCSVLLVEMAGGGGHLRGFGRSERAILVEEFSTLGIVQLMPNLASGCLLSSCDPRHLLCTLLRKSEAEIARIQSSLRDAHFVIFEDQLSSDHAAREGQVSEEGCGSMLTCVSEPLAFWKILY